VGLSVSEFSAVDAAAVPARLVAYLDQVGLTAMRHYMAVTHSQCDRALVLDIGCGIGRDIVVLDGLGVAAIGVDPSSFMLRAAAGRVRSPLARATAEELPFPDDVFTGCLVQRVLMHVDNPATLIAEAVRCVQRDGVVTIFEPDWSTLHINGSPVPAWWTNTAKHPSVGGEVGELLTVAGCTIRDRVEERSWWTFDEFERIINPQRYADRAVEAGVATRSDVETWLAAQHRRAAANEFRAGMAKILWVATTP
jgi:ubiquinone/menaquinone biosynthesis C-methylase UbiE